MTVTFKPSKLCAVINPSQLNVCISGQKIIVTTGIPVIREYVGGLPYEGEYEVDPSFEVQTLETQNRLVDRNINVNKIEVSSVGNPSGGNTVYIGGIF